MKRSLCLGLLCILLGSSRHLFAQVDLPTGSAQVNFPLYNYSNDSKLGLNVSLNYTGGNGIKVTEVASNVGLGWTIQAGGVISRSTRGEPDDQVGGILDGDNIPTGRIYSNYAYTTMPVKAGWIPLQDYVIHYYRGDASVIDDREADILTYSFNGRQGSFMIGPNGSAMILDNSKLKIEKVDENLSTSNILTRWSKFIVTDENGIRYTFSEKNLDRIILYETYGQKRFFFDPPVANLQTYTCKQTYKVTNYSAVNNWYLSEILDPLTNKKITFTYENYNLDYISGIQASYSVNPADDGQQQIVAQRIEPHYTGTVKRLTNIDLPDNNQLTFSYFSNERADLPGDKALFNITVKKAGSTQYGYIFNYQYFSQTNVRDFFYGFTSAEAAYSRLCLESFNKFGVGNYADQKYTFTYNTGTSLRGVPGRNTPAFDHYGYYNGNTTYDWTTDIGIYNNAQNLCLPNKRVVIGNVDYMGAGMLTSIKYPTGGILSYEYEVNDARDGTSNVKTGGLRVKKVISSDGMGANPDIVKEYKYVQEDGTSSSGWGYEAPRYLDTSRTVLVIPTKGSYIAANLAYSVAMPTAQTLFKIYAVKSNLMAGIAKGKTEAGIATSQISSLTTSLASSLVFIAVSYLVRDAFTSDSRTTIFDNQVYYSAHAANQNPLPMLYRRVEVYEGTSTDNLGKTIYEFTSDQDFAINYPIRNSINAPKQRYVPGLYGLQKRQVILNKNGELVEDKYNKYTADIKVEGDNSIFTSTTYRANQMLVTNAEGYGYNYSRISFASEKHSPISGNAMLAYTVDKKYTGNNYQMKRTDYEYDLTYYNLKKITVLNSFNEKEEKRFYYPYDYTASGVFKTMLDNHIYNVPISSETWILKPGGEEQLAGAEIKEYLLLNSGQIKPSKVYLLSTNAPIPQSTIGAFSPSTLVRNSTYFKEAVNYSYNTAGYLATTSSLNSLTSYIYNDENEVIIAQVTNAGITDIGYSSFEAGAKGTWTVNASGTASTSVINNTSPSGQYCLSMPAVSSVAKTGLNASKKYRITYWQKDGTINVSGGTKTDQKALLVRNGWTLMAMTITQATGITITGTGLMDELRLYPDQCQMVSFSYDSHFNVTTTTSPDNTAIYFEYDLLGRLKNTYDADRNLVKSTDYKYVQQ
jgi:YD repeat-containing protein